MKPPRARRQVLLRYGLLLGLPTLLLVGLLWRQQRDETRRELARAPADASFAAGKLGDGIRRRFEALVAHERQRPPAAFADTELAPPAVPDRQREPAAVPARLALVPGALCTGPRPSGVQAWFFGEVEAYISARDDPPGVAPDDAWWFSDDCRQDLPASLRAAVRSGAYRYLSDWFELLPRERGARAEADPRLPAEARELQLLELAFLRAQTQSFPELLGNDSVPPRRIAELLQPLAAPLTGVRQPLVVGRPWLRVERTAAGEPLLIMSRMLLAADMLPVRWDELDAQAGAAAAALASAPGGAPDAPLEFAPRHPIDGARRPFSALQGWVLDLDWLLEDVVGEVAASVLKSEELLVDPALPHDLAPAARAELDVLELLGIEGAAGMPGLPELGRLTVAIDDAALARRARLRWWRFAAVSAMLLVSFASGLYFLLSGVRRELEGAERVQNFVSAVTHELRTPVSTIALHAEMLQEGWVQGDDQRTEYYQRIVGEAERLSELVERVLRKARLSSGESPAEEQETSADLSALVERAAARVHAKRPDDVRFELAADLPPALLTAESVESIVENLVENARKYAPVPEDGEPILVRTLERDGQVVLEVCDRGPGVPKKQRAKVFEAFYRVGSERTRSAKGTGLGLHLVQLQAEALGGAASVREREAGGAVFEVAFPVADAEPGPVG